MQRLRSVGQIGLQSRSKLLALPTNIRQGLKGHDNNKHSSLLRYGNNYGNKNFLVQAQRLQLSSKLGQIKNRNDLQLSANSALIKLVPF